MKRVEWCTDKTNQWMENSQKTKKIYKTNGDHNMAIDLVDKKWREDGSICQGEWKTTLKLCAMEWCMWIGVDVYGAGVNRDRSGKNEK